MKVAFFSVVLVLVLSSCSDSTTTLYATHADAVKDGAVGRGWVPSFIPGDAVDIRESHAVDVGQVVITFKSENLDFLRSLNALHSTYKEEAREALSSIEFPGYDLTSSAEYHYSCSGEGVGLLAFDKGQDRYYYYEPLTGERWSLLCVQNAKGP
jgi:hypothetical protein